MRSRSNSTKYDNAESSSEESLATTTETSSTSSSPRFFIESEWPFDSEDHEHIYENERRKTLQQLIDFCNELSLNFIPSAPETSPQKKTQKRSISKISSTVRRTLFSSPSKNTPSIFDLAISQLTMQQNEDSSSSEEDNLNPLDFEFEKQTNAIHERLKSITPHRQELFFNQYGIEDLAQNDSTKIKSLSPARLVMLLYLSSKAEKSSWQALLNQLEQPTDSLIDHFIRIKNGKLHEEKSEQSESEELRYSPLPSSL